MPIYEYHCDQCQSDVEVLVRRTEEKAACPECGSTKMTKLLSVAAAPATSSSSLPVCANQPAPTCGRPQCGSGCMFD